MPIPTTGPSRPGAGLRPTEGCTARGTTPGVRHPARTPSRPGGVGREPCRPRNRWPVGRHPRRGRLRSHGGQVPRHRRLSDVDRDPPSASQRSLAAAGSRNPRRQVVLARWGRERCSRPHRPSAGRCAARTEGVGQDHGARADAADDPPLGHLAVPCRSLREDDEHSGRSPGSPGKVARPGRQPAEPDPRPTFPPTASHRSPSWAEVAGLLREPHQVNRPSATRQPSPPPPAAAGSIGPLRRLGPRGPVWTLFPVKHSIGRPWEPRSSAGCFTWNRDRPAARRPVRSGGRAERGERGPGQRGPAGLGRAAKGIFLEDAEVRAPRTEWPPVVGAFGGVSRGTWTVRRAASQVHRALDRPGRAEQPEQEGADALRSGFLGDTEVQGPTTGRRRS